MGRCISALDTHSKKRNGGRACCFVLLLFIGVLIASALHAGIKDRVVAYVDTTAITLTELDKKHAETMEVTPAITKEEVLNTMINRILLIREARKIRLKSEREDELLKEYVDLKIKSFIRIKDEELRNFYEAHAADFPEKDLDDLREDIENYLIEQELNNALKKHIDDLRNNACIKVQIDRELRK